MSDRPSVELSMDEVRLLLELLGREDGELPVEIHHTFTREYRRGLKARKEMVDRLIETLRAMVNERAA